MPQHLPRYPKNTILEPTFSSRAPKTLAQNPKKPLKVMEGWSFLHFSHFSNDRKKSNQKCSQDPPKAAKLSPRWPSWRHHGPSWAQLAANLAHLASILGPSSPQLRQKSPQNLQEALPDIPRRPRESPEGSRTASRASISMVSGSILDFICRSISKDLTQFATPC